MQRHTNKLGRKAYKVRDNPSHHVHKEHEGAVKTYDCTLEKTKQQHWRDWLERAEDPDIWTVHKLISAPALDGAKARIPALKHQVDRIKVTASTNQEKSKV